MNYGQSYEDVTDREGCSLPTLKVIKATLKDRFSCLNAIVNLLSLLSATLTKVVN